MKIRVSWVGQYAGMCQMISLLYFFFIFVTLIFVKCKFLKYKSEIMKIRVGQYAGMCQQRVETNQKVQMQETISFSLFLRGADKKV